MVNLRVVRYYSSMPIRELIWRSIECVYLKPNDDAFGITCPQKIQVCCSKDVKLSESFTNDHRQRTHRHTAKLTHRENERTRAYTGIKTISEVTFQKRTRGEKKNRKQAVLKNEQNHLVC